METNLAVISDYQVSPMPPPFVDPHKSDIFDRAASYLGKAYNETKRKIAKAKFEKEIQGYIKLANAHKAKGVKKGDEVFVNLYAKCVTAITNFTTIWGGNPQSVIDNAPALRELYTWSVYDEVADHKNKFKLVMFTVLGSAISIGVLSGIVEIVHHAMTFWLK